MDRSRARLLVPLRKPIVWTAAAFVGQLIWLVSVSGRSCTTIGDRASMLFVLAAVGALGEMFAAAARGRDWGTRLLGGLICGLVSAVVLIGCGVMVGLLAVHSSFCFD
mgnify:CR=1 FL=1